MAIEGKLATRNGKLYVVYAQTLDSEPTRKTMWWRTINALNYWGRSPEAGDVAVKSIQGGTWNTHRPGGASGSVSTGDGSQLAEFVEESPVIPPSAGGKELRWYHGEWQKLLRTGWVPAGEGGKKKPKGKAKLEGEIAESLARKS
jgi:hypothetical protein